MLDAKKYADKASLSAASASQSATAAADSADEAESYAASWKGSLLPQGVVAFSELPTSGLVAGHLYAVKDKFITDGRFEEGEKHQYPAGTCAVSYTHLHTFLAVAISSVSIIRISSGYCPPLLLRIIT